MINIKDKNTWNSILYKNFNEYDDIYFKYEYYKLWGDEYGMVPEAFYWEKNEKKVFWPHLISKNIADSFNSESFDYTTPYGYGGFLSNCNVSEFLEDYKIIIKGNEFIRFHPVIANWKLFDNAIYINDIVVIDLCSLNLKKGHGYNIRKSKDKGCKYKIIENPLNGDINNFIRLYYNTMDRNKTDKRYYFNKNFIKKHFELLDSFIIEVKYKDIVIGSCIFMRGSKLLHYFLSGSDLAYSSYYPTDLMIWASMEYARKNKYRMIVLGGGRGKNDSLYVFKKGFSNTTYPFYIGKI